jgi:phosphoribosyl-ATP pyrophosphohydrolase
MFEKDKEYKVKKEDDYFYITSDFVRGYELNEHLLKYFKPKEMKSFKVLDKVKPNFEETHIKKNKVYDVLAVENYGNNRNSIFIKDDSGDIREFWVKSFELVKEKTDSIVESVVNKFIQRSKVGIKKYGTTLNENNKDNFLNHLQEELMDATNYIEKLKSQQKNNVQEKVIEWAKERQLVKLGNAPKQIIKLSEEVGELSSAFLKNDFAETKDAIGDIMIVLTILCEQLSIDMNQCYSDAYEVIKNRKGKTINGSFIKDENNDKENNS